MKRALVYSMSAGTWSRVLPDLTSDDNVHIKQLKFFATMHMSVNDSKSARVLILDLQINFYWIGELANTNSINNEDQLYI